MALISCSECGGQLSDQAASCPHCGHPRRVQARDQNALELVIASVEALKNENQQDHQTIETKVATQGKALARLRDHEHDFSVRWVDLPENERWKVAFGVWWRGLVAYLVILAVIYFLATQG